jgi:hypothetical protein
MRWQKSQIFHWTAFAKISINIHNLYVNAIVYFEW